MKNKRITKVYFVLNIIFNEITNWQGKGNSTLTEDRMAKVLQKVLQKVQGEQIDNNLNSVHWRKQK